MDPPHKIKSCEPISMKIERGNLSTYINTPTKFDKDRLEGAETVNPQTHRKYGFFLLFFFSPVFNKPTDQTD